MAHKLKIVLNYNRPTNLIQVQLSIKFPKIIFWYYSVQNLNSLKCNFFTINYYFKDTIWLRLCQKCHEIPTNWEWPLPRLCHSWRNGTLYRWQCCNL